MDDSRFDQWTRSIARAFSRRSVIGSSIGMMAAGFVRTPAIQGAGATDPWFSDWCTVVDGTTHGWAEFETDDKDVIEGEYGNEVGHGKIKNCKFFEPYRLDCQWIQTSDGTRGTFSIR
jgi:hypothetical protein